MSKPKILFLFTIFSISCIENVQIKKNRLTDHFNVFIGTARHGHTYLGAILPCGVVQLSLDNLQEGWDRSSGYPYTHAVIFGSNEIS